MYSGLSQNNVKGRVKNVLHYRKPAFWIVLVAILICTIVAVCFLTNPQTEDYSEVETSSEEGVLSDSIDVPVEKPEEATEIQVQDTARTISLGDIDNNGVDDFVIAEEALESPLWKDKYYFRWTLVYNNEEIYTGYDGVICEFKAWCFDLDEDSNSEIFVRIFPHANSRPLEKYVVLKKTDDTWKELANSGDYHMDESGDGYGSNAFPIHGYVGKEHSAIMEIVCEGFDFIEVDTTKHYEKVMEDTKDEESLQDLYQYADAILHGDQYQMGNLIGQTCDWGIWSLRIDTIQNKTCIVATHGLESIKCAGYDTIGTVDIYFNYDASGEINILKMTFRPWEEE